MEDQLLPANSEAPGLSIKDLFYKYIRFLPLFIVSVALSLIVAYTYLRYSTPVYTASGNIMISDDKSLAPRGGDSKFDQVLSTDQSKNIQNEIEILKSRQLMERVVKDLDLNFAYYAKGKIKDMNNYKTCPFGVEAFQITDSAVAFTLIINFENANTFTVNGNAAKFHFGEVFKNAFGIFRLVRRAPTDLNDIYRVTWTPTYNLASALSSQVVISPKIPGTAILTIVTNQTNAILASDIVNQLMKEYQVVTLEDKNLTKQQSARFINERLAVVTHELDSINKRRLQYMENNNILDPDRQSGNYYTLMTQTDKDITDQRLKMDVLDMISNYLRDKKTATDPVPSSLGIADVTLNGLIVAYNTAQLEKKALLDGNVPRGNVLVREKEDQVEKLRQNILESIRNLRTSYAAALSDMERQNNAAAGQIRDMPLKQRELDDIKLQMANKQSLYNYLMEKKEENGLALAANITDSKILDEATPNWTPISPKRTNTQMVAAAIGLLLPSLFIFVLELTNDKVTTRHDIERVTNTPILGEVGHSFSNDVLVVTANNRSVVAEQFRIIRSNLQYVLNHIEKPVIMVTSSFSGEGKSFVSTNMGAVMALAGKRTIILEFDIRKPKILSELHIPKRPGVTNYLLGKVKAEELPLSIEGYNDMLYVLPCGPVPPNPSEMLLDPKLGELFVWLRQHFDVVIMDTPPIGMVSDAMTLSKFADATLYIVRQGHTYKKQIGLIDELHRDGKLPKVSVVTNDIKIRIGYGYYGYGRYGYGYGYGSNGNGYYEEEQAPPTFVEKWFGWLDPSNKKKKRKSTKIR